MKCSKCKKLFEIDDRYIQLTPNYRKLKICEHCDHYEQFNYCKKEKRKLTNKEMHEIKNCCIIAGKK